MKSSSQSWELRAAAAASALSHKTRVLLVTLLSGRELSVGELSSLIGISPSSASQHLTKLRHAGILLRRRDRAQIIYSVRPGIEGTIPALYELIQQPQAWR